MLKYHSPLSRFIDITAMGVTGSVSGPYRMGRSATHSDIHDKTWRLGWKRSTKALVLGPPACKLPLKQPMRPNITRNTVLNPKCHKNMKLNYTASVAYNIKKHVCISFLQKYIVKLFRVGRVEHPTLMPLFCRCAL